ncbi:hypothetical protein LWI29_024528 [Acer saccharum]|uniref:Uncharacterized protein n=1 Tax=Acer saccharum TaxID=4024 RepID=A0AA39SHS2_ACESA|nr:hypothetical protein LWI29_024528 [Acer saccharum]
MDWRFNGRTTKIGFLEDRAGIGGKELAYRTKREKVLGVGLDSRNLFGGNMEKVVQSKGKNVVIINKYGKPHLPIISNAKLIFEKDRAVIDQRALESEDSSSSSLDDEDRVFEDPFVGWGDSSTGQANKGRASKDLEVGSLDIDRGLVQRSRPDGGDSSSNEAVVGMVVKGGHMLKGSSIKKHKIKTRRDVISNYLENGYADRIFKGQNSKTDRWNLENEVANVLEKGVELGHINTFAVGSGRREENGNQGES